MRCLKEGYVNSKLFHTVANGRWTKNFIPGFRWRDEIVTDQDRKVEIFTEAFRDTIGAIYNREHNINLDELITEEEVWGVIKDMPHDRAPGLDGFISAFYQRAWPVIKKRHHGGSAKAQCRRY
jgi:hypothetical protein